MMHTAFRSGSGLDGLTAVARFHRELPPVGVIMLTTFGQDEYVTRALEEGADGFLLKADDPRELLNGVRAVGAGGAYLFPRVAGRVIAGLRAHRAAHPHRSPERLTEREHEVLAGIGAGCPTRRSRGVCTWSRDGEGACQRGAREVGRTQPGGGGHLRVRGGAGPAGPSLIRSAPSASSTIFDRSFQYRLEFERGQDQGIRPRSRPAVSP